MCKEVYLQEFYNMELNRIYNENCLEGMRKLPDNSIDLIPTDCPYGISFMGKQWDKAIPSIDIWKECLRVLKPGAFAFVMCIPRQDCLSRMIISLEDAGFNVNFSSIYWCYASGFPKASNISKMVDKRLGAERKTVGQRLRHGGGLAERYMGITQKPEVSITLSATSQAKALDGSYAGFQPKPALEIILVAMKPLSEKTYVDQALKNRKGIVWFDDARIPYKGEEKELDIGGNFSKAGKVYEGGMYEGSYLESKTKQMHAIPHNQGRFPANILVSDDVLNDGRIQKDSVLKRTHKVKGQINANVFKSYNLENGLRMRDKDYGGDSDSFSRYFSLDAWWDKRIENLPDNVKKTFPFLIVPKASKAEKNKGLEGGTGSNTYNRKCLKCGKWERKQGLSDKYTCHCDKPKWEIPKGNFHPTCKPIKLMSYLIALGSRQGDVILDPFAGSGTTLISAKILQRKYVGFEISKGYYEIAIKRLQAIVCQKEFNFE